MKFRCNCGKDIVLDKKPAAKIEVICPHCGEKVTVDPAKVKETAKAGSEEIKE